jgi:transcriptional regulator of acetoin/glycerol metabolism
MPEDLPDHLHTSQTNFRCVIPPYLTKEDIEREAIAQTLERTGGNIKKTAQILNYHRPTLYRKIRRFGLRATIADEEISTPATGSIN